MTHTPNEIEEFARADRAHLRATIVDLHDRGFSNKRIAERMDITESAVQSILNPPREGIPFSSAEELDPFQFIERAQQLVSDWYVHRDLDHVIARENVYVVWFAKVLGNWKALLSTPIPDGRYFEISYDGEKKQAYLDVYTKAENHTIPDHG